MRFTDLRERKHALHHRAQLIGVEQRHDALRELALGNASVKAHTEGKTILKVVVAKGPLVSVVVR